MAEGAPVVRRAMVAPPRASPVKAPAAPPVVEEDEDLEDDEILTYHDCYRESCPFCGRHFFWTDDTSMEQEARAKAPRILEHLKRDMSPEQLATYRLVPELRPGIQVGKREPVFPIKCGCGRLFIVSFQDYVEENTARETRWWSDVGRYHIQVKGENPPATPKSIYLRPRWMSESSEVYAKRVLEIRNPIVRQAIVGAFTKAGFGELFPEGATVGGTGSGPADAPPETAIPLAGRETPAVGEPRVARARARPPGTLPPG
ncbi:MAG: hypothetical protein ACREB9_00175 [Thermoplasmata archaeon]